MHKFKRYLELLFFITMRQIKVRYKQTVLGVGWAVLRPFLTMIVFTVVFSKFARIPSDGIPYPIFSYSALLPWTFFAASLTSAVSSIVGNANLIKQIYFPREILIFASVLAGLFDLAVASVIFIFMLVFYRVPVTAQMLYVFPLLLLMVILVLGISFLLAALNVYYRDIEGILSFGIQLLMFGSPIVYSINSIPLKYKFWYMLNPISVIIDGFRRTIIQGVAPQFEYLGISAVVILAIFIGAYFLFKRAEINFADVV